MLKYIIITLIFIFGLNVQALNISDGVFYEMSKFGGLPNEYIKNFPLLALSQFEKNEKKFLNNDETECHLKFNTQFIESYTKSLNEKIQNFESGLIQINVTYCFENTKPLDVVNLYTNPIFQKNNVSTIIQSYKKNGHICEKTHAPTIGASHYCYDLEKQILNNTISTLSFNVWNDEISNFDAPVYFRLVATTTKQVGNTTFFNLQTLIRGPALNRFQKLFAKGVIESEQKALYEKMKNQL